MAKTILNQPDNTARELASIWKLIGSIHAMELSNGTFSWFAVGIPMNLIDKTQPEGDLDLLIEMLVFKGFNDSDPDFKKIHRVFEVKTNEIDHLGRAKSLKNTENRLTKLTAQLRKLEDFGVHQLFLLDACIIKSRSLLSQAQLRKMNDSSTNKLSRLQETKYGYIKFFLEANRSGVEIYRPVINLRPAAELTVKKPFSDLVEHISQFYQSNSRSQNKLTGRMIVSYCKRCKTLILVRSDGPYKCEKCMLYLY